jgi:hypothetical protein
MARVVALLEVPHDYRTSQGLESEVMFVRGMVMREVSKFLGGMVRVHG